MSKIYCYECRRLLWNKFFGGLIVVLLCYGALVLRGVTILGVSHTAPFSPWSFGDYLSRMLPLLWIGALFFLSFFTSVKARRTASLIDTTPMLPSHLRLFGALLPSRGRLYWRCFVLWKQLYFTDRCSDGTTGVAWSFLRW